jgi:adenine-specific DNA methylase
MATKRELLAQEVAKAVGAGKAAALETVDFEDPNRPKTCLEVDFPILPVNQVAIIEGNAGKPIYQMSKWWARRRSSVFRSMLIAAATKAPDDPSHAAKLVWDNYYANHEKKGAFKHLKVADIFMGGGTTLVEGSRLGMQMVGNDLNPVAWFVVKQELANVDPEQVKKLLADIEAEVKPQIMPYYCCDGPQGEKGKWTHVPTAKVMPADFDPLAIPREQRKDYKYEGPEVIYTFWAKHGPCQVTGCGHRTPIMTSPVIAVKTLTVKSWHHTCGKCGEAFDVEEDAARMAPDAPLYIAPTEAPYSVLDRRKGVICPHCGHIALVNLGKGKNKKVELSLLVHPHWLAGEAKQDTSGAPYGGSAQDDVAATTRWDATRAAKLRLLEVRGALPGEVTDPETGITFAPEKGTVPKKSHYACAACGTVQDVLTTIKDTGKTGPVAAYVIQGYSPSRNDAGKPYGGRFFAIADPRSLSEAATEWQERKDADLEGYWPRGSVQPGLETTVRTPLLKYGYRTWPDFFNARQLLAHAQILKAIETAPGHQQQTREFVLAAFQQYLRNNNMFCIWNIQADKLEPFLSKNNLQPPTRPIENCVFGALGRGNWSSCAEGAIETLAWKAFPWDLVARSNLPVAIRDFLGDAKSNQTLIGDNAPADTSLHCTSSTDLSAITSSSIDLVVTDPPFGDIMQYGELSGFFYGWLRCVLKGRYQCFQSENPPVALEAVDNAARHGKDGPAFYQRLLTNCWKEAHRILRPGGILTFTFHHDKDDPWVAVLESLFDAGFYLEAAFPVRADETKGEGSTPGTFGAQKVEYDIIHVCRKRTEESKPVSWGRMRREVMADVRQLQAMLENHAREGLPAADIQVIRRGKALEYFSRHYGRVYVDEGRTISVRDALVGINQLIDEDADKGKEAPPVNAEPITRQFLRTFGNAPELKRDQLQKFLKGSITTPDEFAQRGWCAERNKVFTRTDALEFAREWSGRHRRKLTSDLDQALVLIGACFDGSGINALDTLKNDNFKPHVALKPLLEWLHRNGPDQTTRNAASRAVSIYNAWHAGHAPQPAQGSLFDDDGEYER